MEVVLFRFLPVVKLDRLEMILTKLIELFSVNKVRLVRFPSLERLSNVITQLYIVYDIFKIMPFLVCFR